jgi:glutathione S-transferase
MRVSFALAERRITHDVVEVPPTAVRPKGFVVPPEFVDHSPRGEIPMVRVGDAYRADSLPILEWLEECVPGPPLLPADDGGRARVRERTAWIDSHVFPPMIGVYYGIRADRIARASHSLESALGELGAWLEEAPWLAGDAPTLAEAAVLPVWVRLGALARLGFAGRVDERVAAHVDRCRGLEGWAHVAWSDAQTDELVGRIERYRANSTGDAG